MSNEIQAVPPLIPYTYDYVSNKIIAEDKNNNGDYKNGEYLANQSSFIGKGLTGNDVPGPSFINNKAVRMFAPDTYRESAWITNFIKPLEKNELASGDASDFMKDIYSGAGVNRYTRNPYSSTGEYQGGGSPNTYYSTPLTNGKVIKGEWAQIKVPYGLRLTKYVLTPADGGGNLPGLEFYLVGSKTGENWDILDYPKNRPLQTVDGRGSVRNDAFFKNAEKTYIISEKSPSYSYFRIIVNKVIMSSGSKAMGAVSIHGMKLFGIPCQTLAGACENFEPYNIMNSVPRFEGFEGFDTYTKEDSLFTNLKDFNAKYARYIMCNDPVTNAENGVLQCSSTEMKDPTRTGSGQLPTAILQTAYDNLYGRGGSSTELGAGGSIADVKTSIASITDKMSSGQYSTEYDRINNTYKNSVLTTRGELDAKMKELYNTEDSFNYEYKTSFDSTVYTGVLWTVLATTTLYVIFTKL